MLQFLTNDGEWKWLQVICFGSIYEEFSSFEDIDFGIKHLENVKDKDHKGYRA